MLNSEDILGNNTDPVHLLWIYIICRIYVVGRQLLNKFLFLWNTFEEFYSHLHPHYGIWYHMIWYTSLHLSVVLYKVLADPDMLGADWMVTSPEKQKQKQKPRLMNYIANAGTGL